MRGRLGAGTAAILAACPVPAHAADEDRQVWTAVIASTALSDKVDATMEVHGRFFDDPSRLGQLLLRPSLTIKLGSGLSATAGYTYVRSPVPRGSAINEHRTWQQLGYAIQAPDGGRFALTGRTRVEERFREGSSDVGWRLRQQVRLQVPVSRDRKAAALLWNETFVGLNDTRWGQRSNIDQVRTFAGANLALGRGVTLEPGYLNQIVVRRGPDAMNHVAALNLIARL